MPRCHERVCEPGNRLLPLIRIVGNPVWLPMHKPNGGRYRKENPMRFGIGGSRTSLASLGYRIRMFLSALYRAAPGFPPVSISGIASSFSASSGSSCIGPAGRPTSEANGILMFGVSTSVMTAAVMDMITTWPGCRRANGRRSGRQKPGPESLCGSLEFSAGGHPKPFTKLIPAPKLFYVRTYPIPRGPSWPRQAARRCRMQSRMAASSSRLSSCKVAARWARTRQASNAGFAEAGLMPDWIARVSCSRLSPFRSRRPASPARRRARHEQ